MSEPTIRPLGQYEPTPEYHPPKPFRTFVEGQSTAWGRANTATVEAETLYEGPEEDTDEPEVYADSHGARRLVLLDTNYKPNSRGGEHPVYLARTDALRMARALLDATGDTFDSHRCGPLRPAEAADVLRQLDKVQDSLSQLRSKALADLLHGTVDKPDDDLDDLDEHEQEAGG